VKTSTKKTSTGTSARRPAARTHTRAAARGGAVALPMPGALLGGLQLGGVLDALAGISQPRLLDRLIRGRTWIGVVAFALIGIVAMQLWIVKLGTGIGRALESEARLQRENSVLSIENARFSAGERVETLAAARGMVPSAPGTVRFDASHGALDARLAAAALSKSGQVQPAGPDEGGLGEQTTGAESGSVSESASRSGEATGSPSAASSESAEGAQNAEAEGSTSTSASSEGSSAASTGTAGTSSESAATQSTSAATGAAESSSTTTSGAPTSVTEGAATSESTSTVGASGGTEQPATGG
jgi:hypothetical protein